jgi:hypothetical protein
LVVYWCGHGAIALSDNRSKRLFFTDTSLLNLRNLNFDALLLRLTSQQSPVGEVILVADACATAAQATFWPDGKVVGGLPREGRIKVTALYAARSGHKAFVLPDDSGESSVGEATDRPRLPFYTELLFDQLRAAGPDFEWSRTFLEAHKNVEQQLEQLRSSGQADANHRKLVKLAAEGQFPFVVSSETDSEKRERYLALTLPVGDLEAERIALRYRVEQFSLAPDAFAPTRAERKRFENRKQTIFHEIPGAEAWWEWGVATDRRRRIRIVATAAGVSLLVLALVAITYGLALSGPASDLVGRLREEDSVGAVLGEYSPMVRWRAQSKLNAVIADDKHQNDVRDRITHARHRANCSIARYLSGHPNSCLDLLAKGGDEADGHGYDPQARTFVTLNAIDPAGITESSLLERLKMSPEPAALRQGLVLALGQGQSMLPSADASIKHEFRDLLLRLFETDPDPGVHAAAWWCILGKFPDPQTHELLQAAARRLREQGVSRIVGKEGFLNWFVDKTTGLTMVFIRAEGTNGFFGDRDATGEVGLDEECHGCRKPLRRSFAIAMTEANDDHLNFLPGAELSRKAPITMISWHQATEKCNAMTKQSANPQPPFVTFRLPNELEWEFACRGGSIAAFSYGDEDDAVQLARFATLAGRRGFEPHLLVITMPNLFGMFDMHGGIAEWCANDAGPWPPDQERENAGTKTAVFRGGTGDHRRVIAMLKAFARNEYSKQLPQNDSLGFRPAATIDFDSKANDGSK